ncbi:MAG: membrane integrity-associated transporter subunit PqiC [Methylobacteriaceae bacterium]|nr:membrane integrity-associated transporter subunit PqiC [Methylobacteriaceae bacterium]MBV9634177.1 membrane integrity-associated transporter subunit PqiC [Methylobacteriaceae bacterium]
MMAIGAASCAGGSPPQTFDLSAVADVGARVGRGQLVVSEPFASAALDSDRIVVRPHADQLNYYPAVQWADRLPSLVQTRLIESFENAKVLRAVGRPGDRLAATVTLESEIRAFEIDIEQHEAVVEISAKLVSDPGGRILASNLFSARVPAASGGAAASVPALDAALAEVLKQIVAWASARL